MHLTSINTPHGFSLFTRTAALTAVLLAGLACTDVAGPTGDSSGGRSPDAYEFGLMADLPYTEENERMLPALLQDINQADIAFVVHAGDFTRTRCGDDLFIERLAQFQASTHPLVFVPGDNDWTDCHKASDGTYDPEERLAKLRGTFYRDGETLGKQRFELTRQSEAYPENVRWGRGPVLFVAINQPGSNNNLGREDAADREYERRNRANLAWLSAGFQAAKVQGYKALVLIAHSNPGFEVKPELRTGYNDFLAALERETLAFPGQVVMLHADTHYYRVDKPLTGSVSGRRIENFTRIEAFGAPDSHWVKMTVDPRDPDVVQAKPVIVQANRIEHSKPETGGFATRNGVFDPPRVR